MKEGRSSSFWARVIARRSAVRSLTSSTRLDVPAVGGVARVLVLVVEGERRRAVDRDPVVVVEDDQLAEPEGAGERGGLGRDALHEVAVGGDHVGAVVDDLVARAGCSAGPGTSRPSPCRPRSRFPGRAGRWSSRRPGVRKCSGWPGVSDSHWRKRLSSSMARLKPVRWSVVYWRMQAWPGGEDEAVAVLPVRVRRVDPHRLPVEDVGERRERHRRAWMARVGLLDRVHRQRPDRVDRQALDVLHRHLLFSLPGPDGSKP